MTLFPCLCTDDFVFLVQIISFKKYVYVLLGNNFFTVFRGGPLVLEAPGQLPSLPLFPEIQPPTICRTGSEMCTGKRQLNFCLAGKVTIHLCRWQSALSILPSDSLRLQDRSPSQCSRPNCFLDYRESSYIKLLQFWMSACSLFSVNNFWAYPLLLFSFSVLHFLVVGSLR